MKNKLDQAKEFATKAHDGQTRKFSGEPYITHPEGVANALVPYNASEHEKILAWLHDTVEDTDTTFEDIEGKFGSAVAQDVWWLTKESSDSGDSKEYRTKVNAYKLSKASKAAQLVKVSDILHNATSMEWQDPEYWKNHYHWQCNLYLESMKNIHNHPFWKFTKHAINKNS